MGVIQTVLGPRDSSRYRRVLAHEHVFIDLYRVYQPHRDMRMSDEDLAVREIVRFGEVGGQLIVDLTTPDIGRDPARLRRVATAAGVDIVMGCGRYRGPFYEPALDRMPTSTLAAELIREIEVGIDGVRPGVVGEIGTDWDYVSASEERVHRAAAEAALSTGLSIITHSLGSSVGRLQLDVFARESLLAERVAIGHADTYPDRAYHRDLVDAGAHLVFDTVRGMVQYEVDRTLDLLDWAVEGGYADRVMLSHDVCTTGHYHAYGGKGYAFVHGPFSEEMRKRGLSDTAIEGFQGLNAARFLEVRRPV